MISINIYDFDGTIYKGDSTIDFYLFCLYKKPYLVRFIPYQVWHIGLYILGLENKNSLKGNFFVFLSGVCQLDELVKEFWNKNINKLQIWYIDKDHSRDVIISASPDFLLEEISNILKVKKLIATRVNIKTGQIIGRNCHGKEKTIRLKEELKDFIVDKCYTDHLSDMPILNLAKNKYIVNGKKIVNYLEYKPSMIKSLFFKKRFVIFIIVGCINAVIGILLATLFSSFIKDGTVAFLVGYSLSLVISYYINSAVTFKRKDYSVKLFVKFIISYIPNLIIQLVCVKLLIDYFNINNFISYSLSAIIGVPVTFAVLSLFAFKKGKNNL